MALVLSALLPVFLVIAIGAVLRRVLLRDTADWVGLERLTYYVLFPALLIVAAAKADLANVDVAAVAASLVGAVLLLSSLLLVLRAPILDLTGADGPAFTSLFQGAVRWNTYIVLAVAGGLYGRDGIAIVAVAMVVAIPVVNVLCVYVLARFAGSHPPTIRHIAVQLFRNPLIWACAIGGGINFFALPVPKVVMEVGEILGRASLALGLLVVGAGLVLEHLRRPQPAVLLAMGLKLVLKPAVALGLGWLLGLQGMGLVTIAIAAGVPAAPAAYVLARQMGGNAALVANILTLQTLAAAITLPVLVAIARSLAGA